VRRVLIVAAFALGCGHSVETPPSAPTLPDDRVALVQPAETPDMTPAPASDMACAAYSYGRSCDGCPAGQWRPCGQVAGGYKCDACGMDPCAGSVDVDGTCQ